MGMNPEFVKPSILKGPLTMLGEPDEEIALHRQFENKLKDQAKVGHLIYGHQSIDYIKLNQGANRLARFLINKIKAENLSANTDGDWVIAISIEPSDMLIITLVAILKMGAAYVPVDPSFPVPRSQHIIEDSKPCLSLVATEDNVIHKVESTVPIVDVTKVTAEIAQFSSENLEDQEMLQGNQDHIGIILYTSGSTGVPKGVRLPHKVINNRLQWQFATFPYAEDELCCFKTALTFVDSVPEIFGPLIAGLSMVVIPKHVVRNPQLFTEEVDRHGIGRLVLVPSLLRAMLLVLQATPEKKLSNLKLWVCSGETLTPQLVLQFFDYFSKDVKLCNFYGSTEVMGDVLHDVFKSKKHAVVKMTNNKVPIGAPISNTVVYIMDRKLRPVPEGEMGEIYVSGLNIASGYVGGMGKDKFIDNPYSVIEEFGTLYRTGDFAKVIDGKVVYEGRTDSQIKVRGHRVDLTEVEHGLLKVPDVDKAIVLCYHPGQQDQEIVGFFTSKISTEDKVSDTLKELLPPYMQPRLIKLVTLPLLHNGKIDRQNLLRRFEIAGKDKGAEKVQRDMSMLPESKRETALDVMTACATILGTGIKGYLKLESNFFEIGGSSLNAVQVVAALWDKGYKLSVADFLSSASLNEVVNKLVAGAFAGQPPCSQVSRSGYKTRMTELRDLAEAKRIISTSFMAKADLEQWLPSKDAQDYEILISQVWSEIIRQNLSLVVSNADEDVVAVSLNFDLAKEPHIEVPANLEKVFELLECLEEPERIKRLPKGEHKVIHSFMMGTDISLPARENVILIELMEKENLRLCKEKGYAAVMTTNTNPLTQQICEDVLGYEVLNDFQVNTFVANDGTIPFQQAPDSQRARVGLKFI